jgi:hypothetical protein
MCDYSLHAYPNRLAVEGEQLVTYRFPTYSIGLASAAEIEQAICPEPEIPRSWLVSVKNWLNPPPVKAVTAVCLPPGSRLILHQIPKHMRQELDLRPVEEVTFDERSANAYEYRDVIRLCGGRGVLLQDFPEGVRFDVVSMAPMEPETRAKFEPTILWP